MSNFPMFYISAIYLLAKFHKALAMHSKDPGPLDKFGPFGHIVIHLFIHSSIYPSIHTFIHTCVISKVKYIISNVANPLKTLGTTFLLTLLTSDNQIFVKFSTFLMKVETK